MQSTIKLKTLTKKEVHPTMLNTSEHNAILVFSENFSIYWNLKSSLCPFLVTTSMSFTFQIPILRNLWNLPLPSFCLSIYNV